MVARDPGRSYRWHMSNSDGRNATAGDAAGPSSEPTDITDGRVLRRRRNREAVIQALVGLIREGDLGPTIEKIADRAEVSPRSIFRYFSDLDDLARTAIETEMIAAMPLAVIPDRGEGELDHRIDQLIAARERLFRSVHPLFCVAIRRVDDIPDVARGLETASSMLLEQVKRQFERELHRLEPDERISLAVALSSAMSLEAWDHQLRRLGQTEDEILHGWRLLLTRSLS